jgi:biopolymer transport protein ExbB
VRPLLDAYGEVRDFLELGGAVLLPILAATFFMWTLILERYWYFFFVHPDDVRRTLEAWQARADQTSWSAHQIRRLMISQVHERLSRFLPFVKTLISVCLLLGLLGTIVGMIEVFDAMAILGGGNPRAMASGVYKAMLPTMSGMVAALSGYYFSARMERFARSETARLAEHLVHR